MRTEDRAVPDIVTVESEPDLGTRLKYGLEREGDEAGKITRN